MSQIKKFEKCDPPKVRFLRPKMVLGDQERFFLQHYSAQWISTLGAGGLQLERPYTTYFSSNSHLRPSLYGK